MENGKLRSYIDPEREACGIPNLWESPTDSSIKFEQLDREALAEIKASGGYKVYKLIKYVTTFLNHKILPEPTKGSDGQPNGFMDVLSLFYATERAWLEKKSSLKDKKNGR